MTKKQKLQEIAAASRARQLAGETMSDYYDGYEDRISEVYTQPPIDSNTDYISGWNAADIRIKSYRVRGRPKKIINSVRMNAILIGAHVARDMSKIAEEREVSITDIRREAYSQYIQSKQGV